MDSNFLKIFIEPVNRGYDWFVRYRQARLESLGPTSPGSARNPDDDPCPVPPCGGGGGDDEFGWVCVDDTNRDCQFQIVNEGDTFYATLQECLSHCDTDPPTGTYKCVNPNGPWGSRCIFILNDLGFYLSWSQCENECITPPDGCFRRATICPGFEEGGACNSPDGAPTTIWLLCGTSSDAVVRSFGTCYTVDAFTKPQLVFGDIFAPTVGVYTTCDECCTDCCDCKDCCYDTDPPSTLVLTSVLAGFTQRCAGDDLVCASVTQVGNYELTGCVTQTDAVTFTLLSGDGPDMIEYDCVNNLWKDGTTGLELTCSCSPACSFPCPGQIAVEDCPCFEACVQQTLSSSCYAWSGEAEFSILNELTDCNGGCQRVTNTCSLVVDPKNCFPFLGEGNEIECANGL